MDRAQEVVERFLRGLQAGYVSQWLPLLWLLAALGLHGAGRHFRWQARRALGVATDDDAHRLAEMDPRASRHQARARRLHQWSVYALLSLPLISLLAQWLPLR